MAISCAKVECVSSPEVVHLWRCASLTCTLAASDVQVNFKNMDFYILLHRDTCLPDDLWSYLQRNSNATKDFLVQQGVTYLFFEELVSFYLFYVLVLYVCVYNAENELSCTEE